MKKLLAAMFVALLMVGCGEEALNAQTSKNEPGLSIDLDDNETLEGIIAEAIDGKKLQERGKEGEKLAYATNQETPYTGWAKEMNDNGQIEMLAQIKDGKLDGLLTEWYENGQKKLVGSLKDGKLDGLLTEWDEDGQKREERNYKDGNANGLLTNWHKNGQKARKGNYKDGKMDGPWVDYKEDGTVNEMFTGTYKDGEKVK